MQTELFEVNTPATLGVTPRYVLQHNAISRSAHNFSATAKKLTAMAMALLPSDLASLSAAFTFSEFCTALNYTKSGRSFSLFKAAVKECMESVIQVETPPDKKGKTSWVLFHWFRKAEFNRDTGMCTMTFDQDLACFLGELKRIYARINLSDIGKLQSQYAIRIYEMVISYKSMQGKDGNREKSWYMERTVPEFRKILGIAATEYPENHELRRRVFTGPIAEINKAGIGVKIKATGKKKGRKLDAIRLDCEDAPRTVAAKRGRMKDLVLPETSGTENLRLEKELAHLKELYPDEFAELYQTALDELPSLGMGEGIRRFAAEGTAMDRLKERHGIVK